MTVVEELAEFACAAKYDQLSPAVVDRLKMHLVDTFGCALGALDGPPIQADQGAD
jgi:2-methylcitrate dehydratase